MQLKKVSSLQKALYLTLTFGYACITATPDITQLKEKDDLRGEQSKRSRIVSHLANYGYLYMVAAIGAVITLLAHRNAKFHFAQRLAELQKLGFANAEKMAHAMNEESIQSLKSLVAANIGLDDAKEINKQYTYQTIENIVLLLKNKTISLEKAIEFARTFPDRSILLTIREKAAQGPEAVANLLEHMTKANIELKKAHIAAQAVEKAAHITAQGRRDAAWLRGEAQRFNNVRPVRANVIVQGDGRTVIV